MNNSFSSGWANVGFPSGITNVLERRLPLGVEISFDIDSLSPPLAPENDNRFLLVIKKKQNYNNFLNDHSQGYGIGLV